LRSFRRTAESDPTVADPALAPLHWAWIEDANTPIPSALLDVISTKIDSSTGPSSNRLNQGDERNPFTFLSLTTCWTDLT
jgi:hypothetical protein